MSDFSDYIPVDYNRFMFQTEIDVAQAV